MHEVIVPSQKRIFRPFVSSKFLTKVEEMLRDLSGLNVVEQLNHRRIKKIQVLFSVSEGSGYLYPSKDGNSFDIVLSARGEYMWPLVVGHEIAHTYITFDTLDGRLVNLKPLFRSQEDEDLCDAFAFCWLLEGHNAQELARILSPLSIKKENQPQPKEYQLGFML